MEQSRKIRKSRYAMQKTYPIKRKTRQPNTLNNKKNKLKMKTTSRLMLMATRFPVFVIRELRVRASTMRKKVCAIGREIPLRLSCQKKFDCSLVTRQPQSFKAFYAGLSRVGMPPVRLALRDVGNMHLHHGDAYGADAVGQGDGSVGVATGVHHHAVILVVGLLQLVDQYAFMVRLEIGDLVLGKAAAELFKIGLERHRAVDFRFALAQKVEVGAVEDEDFHRWNFSQK